jgi:hypothetical protein
VIPGKRRFEARASQLRARSTTLRGDVEFSYKEVPMKFRQAVLVALAAAVTLTSVSAAAHDAAKTANRHHDEGVANPSGFGEFVLTPLEAGALKRDAGPESSVWSEPRRDA